MKTDKLLTMMGAFTLSVCVISGCATTEMDRVPQLLSGAAVEQQLITTGLSISLAPAPYFERFGKAEGDRSYHTDITYLETVLSYGPVADPKPLFLLTNAYIVTNQQRYGIEYLERSMERYKNIMSDDNRAVYLSAYALLRGTFAEQVPLLNRIGWVLDTFELLEEAEQLSENNPLVHWSAGLIYTQVPGFFGKSDDALKQLQWLAERPQLEPTPGFYREVYHFLAKLHADKGNQVLSARFLEKSGYSEIEKNTLFMGWFASTDENGLLFSPSPWIQEVVDDHVFTVRGFGFSDLYFVVSEDGRELISIDAGTHPSSMKAGYEFLMAHHPSLPPLTTVLITHAHWDHIGGYTYLNKLNPDIIFYGRGNYHGTVERALRRSSHKQLRSESFNPEWITAYQPDVAVDQLKTIRVGDTTIELIPVTGGETEDAMIINLPDLSVLFMGDALMPFYGAPWVEEGFIDETIDTMKQALARNPKHILHGHFGITTIYGEKNQLEIYLEAYQWLITETRKHIVNGFSVKDIIRLNLIPPGLQNSPQAFFSYIAPRDHVISRIADKMLGIWQEDQSGKEPSGLDTITSVEYGRLLELYLDLSVGDVESMLREIILGGDNQLALQMAVSAEKRYSNNEGIIILRNEAADRLRSAVQYFDPFKFVTYTEIADKEHPPISHGTNNALTK